MQASMQPLPSYNSGSKGQRLLLATCRKSKTLLVAFIPALVYWQPEDGNPKCCWITWWRADPDGSVSQVTSMGGTSITREEIGSDQLMSNLTIEMVDASHTGAYTCSVTTVNGNFNASVLLQLTGQSNSILL